MFLENACNENYLVSSNLKFLLTTIFLVTARIQYYGNFGNSFEKFEIEMV